MPIKNIKVVILSLIALVSLVLAIVIDWYFLIITLIILYINNKELKKKWKKHLMKSVTPN